MSDVQESSEEKAITPADIIGPAQLEFLEFLFDNLPHHRLSEMSLSLQEILLDSEFGVILFEKRLFFRDNLNTTNTSGGESGATVVIKDEDDAIEVKSALVKGGIYRYLDVSSITNHECLAIHIERLQKESGFQHIYEDLTNPIGLPKFEELWAVRELFPEILTENTPQRWRHIYLGPGKPGLSTGHKYRVSNLNGFAFNGAEIVVQVNNTVFEDKWAPMTSVKGEDVGKVYREVATMFNDLYTKINRALNPRQRF